MSDKNDQRRRKRSAGEGPDESLDILLASYTPRQREKVLNGLQVLARVAVRSFMEEQAGRSQDENQGEEEDECGE